MTTLENAITFVRTLEERELGFVTSDTFRYKHIREVFEKLHKGEKINGERDLLKDGKDHFRIVEGVYFTDMGHKPTPGYARQPLSRRMADIQSVTDSDQLNASDFYRTLRDLVTHIELVYANPEL
ncbi:MAG: hypothetical protein Q8R00_01330 [Candidatus Nanoarchaeia archaeon]|nr:hypothetical protein [Candidatus Nanoarchaeia archaeon]